MGQQDQPLGFSSLQTNLQLNYLGLLCRESFRVVGCVFKARLRRYANLSEKSFYRRLLLHGYAQGQGVLGRGRWREERTLGSS